MKFKQLRLVGALSLSALALAACDDQGAAETDSDEQIKIVGSSTVYPFSSSVAEEFGGVSKYSTPTVESTGSGGGMKMFCAGVGTSTPDITNASRPMKKKEFKMCQENGVTDITEAKIGYDGIVIAEKRGARPFRVTRKQLLLAVAKLVPNQDGSALITNPYNNWNEIDPSLPNRPILIYGPPKSSGTRDAFEELVMQALTKKDPLYKAVEKKYSEIRDDKRYVESGENDNLIVNRLETNADALGVFGYSFLDENRSKIQGSIVDGVTPTPAAISDGSYPVSRSLFFYVKNAHIDKVPGLSSYTRLFMSDNMIGPDGKLKKIGLIPLPEAERAAVREAVKAKQKLTIENFEK